ncbi:hypothetical protein ACIBRY_32810 [Streptomyces anulatus]
MRILSVPGGPGSGSAGARREAPNWSDDQAAGRFGAYGRPAHVQVPAPGGWAGPKPQTDACTAVAGQEGAYLTDTREALSTLSRDIEAGEADHLL